MNTGVDLGPVIVAGAPSRFSRVLSVAGGFGAALALILAFVTVGPWWQIHDDAMYAMLADGYGMVTKPVDAVPYMHPLVGEVLGLFRRAGSQHSYALFLVSLSVVVATVVGYSLARARVGFPVWVLGVGALLPVVLGVQYTLLCGLLVAASAALLWSTAEPAPSWREWAVTALLLWTASLLRVEMLVMAVLCLFTPLLIKAWMSGAARSWSIGFALAAVAVVVGHIAADWATTGHRLDAFYRVNNPMAVLMNYGFIEALQIFRTPLPEPFRPSDIELLAHWFFADGHLMQPAGMNDLVASVPAENIFKVRYWAFLAKLKSLAGSPWFWLLLAATGVALSGRPKVPVLVGIGLFIALFLASAVMLKPLPERVAGGMAFGLFVLALLASGLRSPDSAAAALWVRHALSWPLVIVLVWSAASDRARVENDAAAWRADRSALAGMERVYYFAAKLPLRGGFEPFAERQQLPELVSLGSMYLTPEVQDDEAAMPCGGFVGCLRAGQEVSVMADDSEIEALDHWLSERYGVRLVVKRKVLTPSFQLQVVRTDL